VEDTRQLIVGLVIVLALLLGLRAACDDVVLPEEREVSRVASPDGSADAVLRAVDPGATSAVAYHVAIVARGAAAGESDSVFVADGVDEGAVRLRWRGRTLEVRSPGARVFRSESRARRGDYAVRYVR